MSNQTRRIWQIYVSDVRNTADGEMLDAMTDPVPATRRAVIVALTAAISLTIINFTARDPSWLITLLDIVGLDTLSDDAHHAFRVSDSSQFNSLALWGTMQLVGYVALPAIVIKLILRQQLPSFGLRLRGLGSHWRIYATLAAISLPLIVAVSFTPAFQGKYPFYDLSTDEAFWPYLWSWWAIYAAQFIALEFFFRGFLIHGLRHRLGYLAVFAMVIPYTMIHFGKPVLEALAAIAGGTVLGTLSLKTRSIWWGAALHLFIAATMDILALAHKGLLG